MKDTLHLRDENCFGDLRFCAGVAEYSVLGYDAASLGKGLPKDKASYGGRRETSKITSTCV